MPLLLMLLLGGGLLAQQPSPPKKDEMPIFRAGITLVKVDVEVVGRDNISDLTKQDFRVFDENQQQEIAYFGREFEPLDLLLLLDVSGSMRRSLEDIAAATRAALANLHPGDRIALMLFSRRAEVIQPFTDDLRNTQYKILDSIYKQNLGNGTLINESLIAAADYMKQQPVKGRRAILIVTDNEGIYFKSRDVEVVRSIHSADTVLNALIVQKGPKPPVLRQNGYTNPDFALPDVGKIANQTGGLAVERVGQVSEVFQKIIERIRSRYFIQYPAPAAEPGAYRHIRVELTPGARSRHPEAVIRARDGYYATGQ